MPHLPAMPDEHDLSRFIEAQASVIDQIRRELGDGRKRSHWMWFIFPQIKGLGYSSTAQYYAIVSLAEAKAYLQHPVLGQRLHDCTELVNRVEERSAPPDLWQPGRSEVPLFHDFVCSGRPVGAEISRGFGQIFRWRAGSQGTMDRLA